MQKGDCPRPGFGLEVDGWVLVGGGGNGDFCLLEEMVREMEAARCSALNFKSHEQSVSKPEVALAPLVGGKEGKGMGNRAGQSFSLRCHHCRERRHLTLNPEGNGLHHRHL